VWNIIADNTVRGPLFLDRPRISEVNLALEDGFGNDTMSGRCAARITAT